MTRHSRFPWSEEYDELARDARAIIAVRCRGHLRSDWSALEQAFPGVERNSCRQRTRKLELAAEGYSARLENAWEELWHQYRGTPELPDEDSTDLRNFDLLAHISFLRKHLDKRALWVSVHDFPLMTTKYCPLQSGWSYQRCV